MVEYTKPWLSLEQQVERLVSRGVDVGDRDRAASLLKAIGYYRLTGYLYPFRKSEQYDHDDGRTRTRVLSGYRPGTTLHHVESIIDFDRCLRMLVMDGVERIEVAVRMQVGYVLGCSSAFAHEEPASFTETFTEAGTDPATGQPTPSAHTRWLEKVEERRAKSDEQFVAHFREKYDDRTPVWALTEVLEMGQLSRLYQGLNQQDAEEIATAFGVPTKRLMASWLASLNYVRNVAAHHARLFNRKLQYAPARPKTGQVTLLDHLRDAQTAKGIFGTYNALAVIAYLLPSFDLEAEWSHKLVALLQTFPTSHALTIKSMGYRKAGNRSISGALDRGCLAKPLPETQRARHRSEPRSSVRVAERSTGSRLRRPHERVDEVGRRLDRDPDRGQLRDREATRKPVGPVVEVAE